MPPVGFEPTIAAGERPKTYALDRAATGTGRKLKHRSQNDSYWHEIHIRSLKIPQLFKNIFGEIYMEAHADSASLSLF